MVVVHLSDLKFQPSNAVAVLLPCTSASDPCLVYAVYTQRDSALHLAATAATDAMMNLCNISVHCTLCAPVLVQGVGPCNTSGPGCLLRLRRDVHAYVSQLLNMPKLV